MPLGEWIFNVGVIYLAVLLLSTSFTTVILIFILLGTVVPAILSFITDKGWKTIGKDSLVYVKFILRHEIIFFIGLALCVSISISPWGLVLIPLGPIFSFITYLQGYISKVGVSNKHLIIQKGYFSKKNHHVPLHELVTAYAYPFRLNIKYFSLVWFDKRIPSNITDSLLQLGPIMDWEAFQRILVEYSRGNQQYHHEKLKRFLGKHRRMKFHTDDMLEHRERCLWVNEKDVPYYSNKQCYWLTDKKIIYLYARKCIIIPYDKIARIATNKGHVLRISLVDGFTIHKTKKGQKRLFMNFSNQEELEQIYDIIEQQITDSIS